MGRLFEGPDNLQFMTPTFHWHVCICSQLFRPNSGTLNVKSKTV